MADNSTDTLPSGPPMPTGPGDADGWHPWEAPAGYMRPDREQFEYRLRDGKTLRQVHSLGQLSLHGDAIPPEAWVVAYRHAPEPRTQSGAIASGISLMRVAVQSTIPQPVSATLPAHDQIGRLWRSYRINVLPPRCSPVQETETKRAFYAGAFAALSELDATASTDIPEAQQIDRLQAMMLELIAFQQSVVKGHG